MSACFSNCKVGPRAPGLEIGEDPGVHTRAQLLLAGALSPWGQMATVNSPLYLRARPAASPDLKPEGKEGLR